MESDFWEALSAISTLLAVVVALFQDKIWKWFHRPKPALSTFDLELNDTNPISTIMLSIKNNGDAIKDAQVFLMGLEYISKVDKLPCRRRTLPVAFKWLAGDSESIKKTQKLIYGEEPFIFLSSECKSNGFWMPHLVLDLSPTHDPFDSFKGDDPNYSITFYLQLKGSNYIGNYWPVVVRYDSGTVGGWIVSPKSAISAKEYNSIFPNHAQKHFSQVESRWSTK